MRRAAAKKSMRRSMPPPSLSGVTTAAVSFQSSGYFYAWQLGVLAWLQQHHDLSRVRFLGASGGAFVACLAAADVPVDEYLDEWMPEVYAGLPQSLPRIIAHAAWTDVLSSVYLRSSAAEEIARRASGRLIIAASRLDLGLEKERFTSFPDAEALASALLASSAIPCVTALFLARQRGGALYLDGCFTDPTPLDESCATVVVPASVELMDGTPVRQRMRWMQPITQPETRELARKGYRDAAAREAHFQLLAACRKASPGPPPRFLK